jgi:hypothetical protein
MKFWAVVRSYRPICLSDLLEMLDSELLCSVTGTDTRHHVDLAGSFLHQRGKAFAFYTTCAIFGVSVANTLSGFIVSNAPWPTQYWWVIGLLGLCFTLGATFVEDTTYPRDSGASGNPTKARPSTLFTRLLAFVPVHGNMERAPPNGDHGPFDSILIGLQPPALLAGCFMLLVFCWSTAVLNNLSVYLQLEPIAGGYGFTPMQNSYFTFTNFIPRLSASFTGISSMIKFLSGDAVGMVEAGDPIFACTHSSASRWCYRQLHWVSSAPGWSIICTTWSSLSPSSS